jgi:hypothetical protein
MGPCALLVAQIMLRDADQSLTDQPIARVRPVRSQSAEPLRQCQGGGILTTADVKGPQLPERAKLVVGIVKTLRKFEGLVKAAAISGTAPLVFLSDTASAAWSFISRRVSGLAPLLRTASACSARPRHSSSSDSCLHSGTAAAVSATPIDATPPSKRPSRALHADCRCTNRNRRAIRR